MSVTRTGAVRVDTGQVRLLLVEDETKMASLLSRGLREEGLLTDVAATGVDGVWAARESEYDALVLDVMLPGIDGFEVCRRFRAARVNAPILMLTARGDAATGSPAWTPAPTTTCPSPST